MARSTASACCSVKYPQATAMRMPACASYSGETVSLSEPDGKRVAPWLFALVDGHSLPAQLRAAGRINLAASWRRVTFGPWGIRARVWTGVGRLASYPANPGTDALVIGRLSGAVSVCAAVLDDAHVGVAPLIGGTLRRFSTARAAFRHREPPILIVGCADQPALAIRVLVTTRAFSLGVITATCEQQSRKNVRQPESEDRHAL